MKSAQQAVKRAVGRGFTKIEQVASAAGVTIETARLHLNTLASEGVVERRTAKPQGLGRPSLIFRRK